MIDVARFGMFILFSPEILRPFFLAEIAEPITLAIIENANLKIRVVDIERPNDGALYHFQLFVVRGNQHVHRR